MFPLVKDKKAATNGSFPLMSNFFYLRWQSPVAFPPMPFR